MAWVTAAGLAGKVYVPDDTGQAHKKHPCNTCFSCQWCDEIRCRVCRSGSTETSACTSMRCCGRNHDRQTPADRS